MNIKLARKKPFYEVLQAVKITNHTNSFFFFQSPLMSVRVAGAAAQD